MRSYIISDTLSLSYARPVRIRVDLCLTSCVYACLTVPQAVFQPQTSRLLGKLLHTKRRFSPPVSFTVNSPPPDPRLSTLISRRWAQTRAFRFPNTVQYEILCYHLRVNLLTHWATGSWDLFPSYICTPLSLEERCPGTPHSPETLSLKPDSIRSTTI